MLITLKKDAENNFDLIVVFRVSVQYGGILSYEVYSAIL